MIPCIVYRKECTASQEVMYYVGRLTIDLQFEEIFCFANSIDDVVIGIIKILSLFSNFQMYLYQMAL